MKTRSTVRLWSWVDAPRRYRSSEQVNRRAGNFHRALSIRERKIAIEVGREITRLRVRAGLSQAALADRLSVSQPYMSYLSRGLQEVPLTMLWDLGDIFGVDAQHFITIASQAIGSRHGGRGAKRSRKQGKGRRSIRGCA